MQFTIYIDDTLYNFLQARAEENGVSLSALINDQLQEDFTEALGRSVSFIDTYNSVKAAIINYKNSLETGKKFCLLDVPEFVNPIYADIRSKLGKTFSAEVLAGTCPELHDIERVQTASGRYAEAKRGTSKGAVYRKIQVD